MKSYRRFGLAVLSLFALSMVSAAQQGPPQAVIVIFNSNADFQAFGPNYRADDRAAADPAGWGYLNRDVGGAVQALENANGFRADHVYSAAVRGFAARLSNAQIQTLRNDPRVAYIEADGVMEANVQTIPWGVVRIGAKDSSTRKGRTGSVPNVNVYVIDTGADAKNTDLNVVRHVNFAGGPNTDCHGHGTHVAGTIAARDNGQDVVGVAPGAPITGVKVLGCGGTGSNSGVIKGIDFVTATTTRPAIANMSLGGGASDAVDTAVRNSAASGVFYSLAAGNEGADACTKSPARAGAGTNNGIMTTAATDDKNMEPSWSNYGSCVDVWAPGVAILSTKKGGGTTTMSGTSMASPHVGGTAALYLSLFTATPAEVEAALKSVVLDFTTTGKGNRAIKIVNAGSY